MASARGCLSAPGDLCGDAEPAAAAFGPDIGVAPCARAAIGQDVTRASVDDGEVAHHTDVYVMAYEPGNLRLGRDLGQEARAVDQRAVGIGVEEIVGQDFVETPGVGALH